MQLTIIKGDNTVIVDGEGYKVDCTALPAGFHALQWDGDSGEVEYAMTRCDHCGARTKKGNEIISDVSQFQPYVDAWGVAKQIAAEARAKFEAEQRAIVEAKNAFEASQAAALFAPQEAGADVTGQQG